MTDDLKRCEFCNHWVKGSNDGGNLGRCTRYPPTPTMQASGYEKSAWAQTREYDVCGEWTPGAAYAKAREAQRP